MNSYKLLLFFYALKLKIDVEVSYNVFYEDDYFGIITLQFTPYNKYKVIDESNKSSIKEKTFNVTVIIQILINELCLSLLPNFAGSLRIIL